MPAYHVYSVKDKYVMGRVCYQARDSLHPEHPRSTTKIRFNLRSQNLPDLPVFFGGVGSLTWEEPKVLRDKNSYKACGKKYKLLTEHPVMQTI